MPSEWNIAHHFQHCQKRRQTGVGDVLQNRDDAISSIAPGNHALELQKAALAVNAVPMQDAVERIKKRLVVDQSGDLPAKLLAVIQFIEDSHGGAVQRPRRKVERHRQTRLGGGLLRFHHLRVVSLHVNAAGKVAAAGDAVDPGHGAFRPAAAGNGKKFVDPMELDGGIANFARGDGAQLHLCPS